MSEPAGVPPPDLPGSASASEVVSGASVVEQILMQADQPAPQPPAQPQPQPAQPPAQPQPQPAQPPMQPQQPQPVQPVQPPPPPAQPPAQSQVDFTSRYDPARPADPLANAEPLPDIPPDVTPAQPSDMNDQQHHAWAALRAQASQTRKLAEDYRAKYNGVLAAAKDYQTKEREFGEQIEAKDKRIHELEDEIGRLDLSRSPEFRERYDAQLNAIRDSVAADLASAGVDATKASELAEQILTVQPSEVPALVSELPPHVQGMVMIRVENADKVWAEREKALEDWRATATGLAAVEERGSAVVQAERISRLAERAVEIVRNLPPDKGAVPAYGVIEPTFVRDRDAKEQQFHEWVVRAPEEQRYAAMFEGFMAPKTYEMCANLWRENQDLKRRLYGARAVSVPPVQPAQPTPPPPPAPPAPPPKEPTVAKDGYSAAPSPNGAADFVAGLLFGKSAQDQPMPA